MWAMSPLGSQISIMGSLPWKQGFQRGSKSQGIFFIVAFTDKHSSFPLCPAERAHNVSSTMVYGITGKKTITENICEGMFCLKCSSTKAKPSKTKQTKKIKGAITVVSAFKMERHMTILYMHVTILYMPSIIQNRYTHFYHSKITSQHIAWLKFPLSQSIVCSAKSRR